MESNYKHICGLFFPQSIRGIYTISSWIFALALFILCFIGLEESRAAAIASAGQDDGYSGRILDKIAAKWKLPKGVSGNRKLNLLLSIDGEGQLVECKVQKASGLPALDASACAAAKAAAPFGIPPYGIPANVNFSFWTGNLDSKNLINTEKVQDKENTALLHNTEAKSSEAGRQTPSSEKARYSTKERYISKITWDLRNAMYVPEQAKHGTYHTRVRIECDKVGNILSSSILESSGNDLVDKYVMQGIERAKKVVPPPEEYGRTFDLNFSLTRAAKVKKK